MIRVIIVEDELDGRDFLKGLLGRYYSDIEVIAETGSAFEGVKLINELKPELIFLDINISGGTGFDILDTITEPKPYIIFTTAHSKFALKAHKYDQVHDYLLKPIDIDDLEESMERFKKSREVAKAQVVADVPGKLKVPVSNGYRYIAIDDILFIKGEGSYSTIYWKGGNELLIALPLKHFENELEKGFMKTHKSFMVNKKSVEQFVRTDGYHLLIEEGHSIPVSRRLKDEVLAELEL